MKAFMAYDWAGNVRQLENVIKRLVILEDETQILEELAPMDRWKKAEELGTPSSSVGSGPPIPLKRMSKRAAQEVEKGMILQALEETNWNRKKAALQLGISYKALLYKLKKMA